MKNKKKTFLSARLLLTIGALAVAAYSIAMPVNKEESVLKKTTVTNLIARKMHESKPTTLRLVCGLPVTHPVTKAMRFFKQRVEAETNGEVKISLYPGGELYSHKDAPRVIPSGAVEMAICYPGHLGGLNPLAYFAAMYFAIPTLDAWEKSAEPILSIWDKSFNKNNIKIIAPIYYGASAFASRKKLIRTPEDLRGLRMRGPTKAHIMCIRAWGAVGVSLAAAEVYDALAKGSIDGCVTGWSTFYTRGLYQAANYFSGPTYQSIWLLVMNLRTWNTLTEEQQKIISAAGNEMWEFTKNAGLKFDTEAIQQLKQKGTVHIFSSEEIRKWMAATKPAYDEMLKKCKKAGYEEDALKMLRVLQVPGY